MLLETLAFTSLSILVPQGRTRRERPLRLTGVAGPSTYLVLSPADISIPPPTHTVDSRLVLETHRLSQRVDTLTKIGWFVHTVVKFSCKKVHCGFNKVPWPLKFNWPKKLIFDAPENFIICPKNRSLVWGGGDYKNFSTNTYRVIPHFQGNVCVCIANRTKISRPWGIHQHKTIRPYFGSILKQNFILCPFEEHLFLKRRNWCDLQVCTPALPKWQHLKARRVVNFNYPSFWLRSR